MQIAIRNDLDEEQSRALMAAYDVAWRRIIRAEILEPVQQTVTLPSGTIPGHGGDGALHVAFAIGKDELDRWEAHLASRGVANFVQEVGELAETEAITPTVSECASLATSAPVRACSVVRAGTRRIRS